MLESCRSGVLGWVAGSAPWAALVALPLVVGACSEDVTRPGFAGDCNDPACIEARGLVAPSSLSSAPGTAGAAGAAGGGGMPAPSEGTLSGSLLQLSSPDLTSTTSLQGDVEVRAKSADSSATKALVAKSAADGTYRLEGVAVVPELWVGVGAFEDPPAGEFVDTLQAVDSTRSSPVNLLVLRREVLTDVVSESFVTNPIEVDPTLAQVVIHFVDENGRSLDGVQIDFPPAASVPTAYDAGEIYSDALDATSTRGVALLANMVAPSYPGGLTSIVATRDGASFTTELQIVSGGVTLVAAVVPLP